MLADSDGQVAANGTSRSYASGKSSQKPPSATGTSNGTSHKASASRNGSAKQIPSETYYGHDREEVTRILIQALSDMGYHSAAQSVSQDSGFELESPTVAAFRSAVLNGSWSEAEQILFEGYIADDQPGQDDNGLVLKDGVDRNIMRFWIRQQKFLELLEQRETGRALVVLRTELTTLYPDTNKLHFLSGLLMCETTDDLKAKADWDGAYGRSRQILLSQLSKCVSPSVMVPEHRLATLLDQVKESQISSCLWHSSSAPPSLYSDHMCERRHFPTENVLELDDHAGEVWQVAFSHDGTKLASCGSDKQVIIWEVPSFRILHCLKDHDNGVGNVGWSWDDSMLVTCCQDRHARLWDVSTGTLLKKLERFKEPVSSCVWAVDNQSFITGSLDKTHSLMQWNLSGEKVYDWACPHRVEDLAISPDGHWMVAMDHENQVHVYDLVTRDWKYEMDLQARLTSVSISQNSQYLLVNHSNGFAQLIDLIHREPVQKYTGHSGGEYMIRNSFGGPSESFVVSGSEDGMIHIWHKAGAHLVEKLNGHTPRCNSISWSPSDPCLFASCGDDGKIKIWSNNEFRRNHLQALQRSQQTSQGANGS
ncbi:WD40-repeat-containing domain protein [Xylariomycetidae sp. FL2044]|nr:WD40-repeat-containing domain protein [Xylariomycetidae sp. FL2044]